MKLSKILIIATMFLATASLSFAQEAKLDEKAPDFTLMDSNGNEHSLSDFEGKYVILEWINFDCPFVVKHYDTKNMQNLQKTYTDKDVVWLSICSSAEGKQGNFDNDEINKRIKDHGANMTAYLIDEDGKVGKMYQAKTTPHMYIIDKEGVLRFAGGIDNIKSTDKGDVKAAKNWIKNGMDELMNGKQITQKTPPPYGCSVKYAN